jgi:DNA-binding transcriptional ArsR family regulator
VIVCVQSSRRIGASCVRLAQSILRPTGTCCGSLSGLYTENRPAVTYNQMVVHRVADETIDHLFHALADTTRRDILRRSVAGELSVSQLARSYPMSFAAVQKHVAVLEEADLITKKRRGREQLVRTNPEAMQRARQALDQLGTAWRGRVDRMSDLLARSTDQQKNSAKGQRT